MTSLPVSFPFKSYQIKGWEISILDLDGWKNS